MSSLDLNAMTVSDLKEELDMRGVAYRSHDVKDTLRRKLRAKLSSERRMGNYSPARSVEPAFSPVGSVAPALSPVGSVAPAFSPVGSPVTGISTDSRLNNLNEYNDDDLREFMRARHQHPSPYASHNQLLQESKEYVLRHPYSTVRKVHHYLPGMQRGQIESELRRRGIYRVNGKTLSRSRIDTLRTELATLSGIEHQDLTFMRPAVGYDISSLNPIPVGGFNPTTISVGSMVRIFNVQGHPVFNGDLAKVVSISESQPIAEVILSLDDPLHQRKRSIGKDKIQLYHPNMILRGDAVMVGTSRTPGIALMPAQPDLSMWWIDSASLREPMAIPSSDLVKVGASLSQNTSHYVEEVLHGGIDKSVQITALRQMLRNNLVYHDNIIKNSSNSEIQQQSQLQYDRSLGSLNDLTAKTKQAIIRSHTERDDLISRLGIKGQANMVGEIGVSGAESHNHDSETTNPVFDANGNINHSLTAHVASAVLAENRHSEIDKNFEEFRKTFMAVKEKLTGASSAEDMRAILKRAPRYKSLEQHLPPGDSMDRIMSEFDRFVQVETHIYHEKLQNAKHAKLAELRSLQIYFDEHYGKDLTTDDVLLTIGKSFPGDMDTIKQFEPHDLMNAWEVSIFKQYNTVQARANYFKGKQVKFEYPGTDPDMAHRTGTVEFVIELSSPVDNSQLQQNKQQIRDSLSSYISAMLPELATTWSLNEHIAHPSSSGSTLIVDMVVNQTPPTADILTQLKASNMAEQRLGFTTDSENYGKFPQPPGSPITQLTVKVK